MQWALISLLLISAAFACGQEVSDRHAKDELAIRRVDEEWLKVFDAGDVKDLDRMEGGDFTAAGEFGRNLPPWPGEALAEFAQTLGRLPRPWLVTKQQQLENVGHRTEKSQAVARSTGNQQFRFSDSMGMSQPSPKPATRRTQAAR
jgi:hypothetical protein